MKEKASSLFVRIRSRIFPALCVAWDTVWIRKCRAQKSDNISVILFSSADAPVFGVHPGHEIFGRLKSPAIKRLGTGATASSITEDMLSSSSENSLEVDRTGYRLNLS